MAGRPPPADAALSPDALDALTELSDILGQVRGPGPGPGTPSQAAAQASQSSAGGGGGGGEIALKDIPQATDNLKHKLQRARAQVQALPDVARSTAEQEREMAVLEARMRRQRDVLARLREIGLRFAAAGDREIGIGDRMEE